MEKLKIRASQLGLFMSKSGKLIQGGKTEALKLWLKHNYGYDEVVASQAMTKGTELEADAIEVVEQVLGKQGRVNADVRALRSAGRKYTDDQKAISFGYYNDYLTGSPDIILDDCIEDIKVPMNIRTFHESELTDNYEWQLRAYMWLTGRKKARLIYVAMPDPDWMIVSKINQLNYQLRDEDMINSYADQIRHNGKCVLKMPLESRVKVFEITHDQEKIEQIKSIVNQVREYCQTLG